MDSRLTLTMSDFAKDFAEQAHRGQLRKDKRQYFTHPERVAGLVRQFKGDSHEVDQLVAAAYCHDLLEDTSVTYYDLVNAFGYCVASLVMELTTNPEMKKGVGDKAKYLSYKLKHMTHWALVIKLCDRLDNISDTNGCTQAWIDNYINETKYIIEYIQNNRTLTRTQCILITYLQDKIKEIETGIVEGEDNEV